MATYDEVIKALQAADAAGASEDARQLAIIANQMKQQPPTLGQRALGVGEAALTTGSSVLGDLIGKIVGVGKEAVTGDFGKGTAEKTASNIQQALTYQPRGQVAPEYLQNVENVMEASKIAPTPLLPNRPSLALKIKAKVPTAEEVKNAATEMYKKIDDAGVVIQAEPFNQFVNKVKETVGGKVREARQPQVVDALKQLDEASGSVKTLQKMQDLRSRE